MCESFEGNGGYQRMKEIVLYYALENSVHIGLIKGVLVQMGIKVKNLTPGRWGKRIGFLAGMEGFEDDPAKKCGTESSLDLPLAIKEELLVLCGLSDEKLDELLEKLKKAGVPKTVMKAIVTETNARWTVYELYGHLLEERRQMETR